MENAEVGNVWEIYSSSEGRWVRAVVAKVDGDEVTFRYEGTLELLVVKVSEVQDKPDRFRVPPDAC